MAGRGVFPGRRARARAGTPPPATAAVARHDIAATTPLTATLGYAGSYPVTGRRGGTLTWLPSAGQVIRQGHALYKTGNGSPVVLLYGSVPDWRRLGEGVTGKDVSQLNHDLVALGDADSAGISTLGWGYFPWETAAGVAKLQSALGISAPSGSVPLGSAVFEPQALRVSLVTGSLVVGEGPGAGGDVGPARGDGPAGCLPAVAGEGGRQGDRDAARRDDDTGRGVVGGHGGDQVRAGRGHDHDDPGAGDADRSAGGGNPGSGAGDGKHHHRRRAGALVVPVTALVAQSAGRYAVEVVGPGNTRRWVPVTPGIFDDASGLVQVTGR